MLSVCFFESYLTTKKTITFYKWDRSVIHLFMHNQKNVCFHFVPSGITSAIQRTKTIFHTIHKFKSSVSLASKHFFSTQILFNDIDCENTYNFKHNQSWLNRFQVILCQQISHLVNTVSKSRPTTETLAYYKRDYLIKSHPIAPKERFSQQTRFG